MNNLETTKMQTPIEIALGVDENGMTTASKLYSFLELNPSNYSKWCKTNITENEFAEENIDFTRFVLEYESGVGTKKREDFKLTSKFARKLSMTQKNHKGELARDYFATLEDKAKEMAINRSQLSPQMQMFYAIADGQAKMELEQKRQAEQLNHVERRVESIREVVALDTTSWRDDTGNILRINSNLLIINFSKGLLNKVKILYGIFINSIYFYILKELKSTAWTFPTPNI